MEAIVGNSSIWTDWFFVTLDWLNAAWPYLWATFAWGLLAMAAFFGFVGVFVPVIPGAIVFFLGAFVHKLMLPEIFSWWVIGGLALVAILDRVVDLFATAAGTKWFGGTKWGIIGALVGGLLGLFFGFVGIILGPVVGAVIFELIWAKRHPKEAARSGLGAGVGFGLSAVGRMILCFIMFGALALDLSIDNDGTSLQDQSPASDSTSLEN